MAEPQEAHGAEGGSRGKSPGPRRSGSFKRRGAFAFAFALAIVHFPESAAAEPREGTESPQAPGLSRRSLASRLRWGGEGGLTLLGENWRLDRAWTAAAFAHVRARAVSVGLLSGVDFWRSPRVFGSGDDLVGVWFMGPQGEFSIADDRVRSAFSVGLTVVVEPTVIDTSAGGLGFYLDARPLGLRFPLGERWSIGLDPLGVRFMIADTSAIPLVETHFLTVLRVEAKP